MARPPVLYDDELIFLASLKMNQPTMTELRIPFPIEICLDYLECREPKRIERNKKQGLNALTTIIGFSIYKLNEWMRLNVDNNQSDICYPSNSTTRLSLCDGQYKGGGMVENDIVVVCKNCKQAIAPIGADICSVCSDALPPCGGN